MLRTPIRLVATTLLVATPAVAQQSLWFEPAAVSAGAAPVFVVRGGHLPMTADADGWHLAVGQGADRQVVRFRVAVDGACRWRATDRLPGVSHYLRSADPASWRRGVAHHGALRAEQVAPGISLRLHARGRDLEYDVECAPGADLGRFEIVVEGAELKVDGEGVALRCGSHELRQSPPIAWEWAADGTRREVEVRCEVRGPHRIGFRVVDRQMDRALVIDPVLSYVSFFGGDTVDEIYDVALDDQGNVYTTGLTASSNLPASGPQTALDGVYDAFICKFDPTGGQLLYATYLGGSGDHLGFERGLAIDVDGAGRAVVVGVTNATDFPVTPNAAQPSLAGAYDAFVVMLDPTGANFVYSTHLGGSGLEGVSRISQNLTEALDVEVEPDGTATVYGATDSTDFPTRNPAQPNYGGGIHDCFVTRYDPAGAVMWSTYLGGSGYDSPGAGFLRDGRCSMSLDGLGGVVLGGLTESPGFAVTASGWAQDGLGFVTRLDSSGGMLFATRYPIPVGAVDVDLGQAIYVSGTAGPGFATTPGAFQFEYAGSSDSSGHGDATLAKFDPSLSQREWATYLGKRGTTDRVTDLKVDATGHAHLAMWGPPLDAPVGAYAVKVNANGSALAYAQRVAGNEALGLDLLPDGTVWLGGIASSAGRIAPSTNAFQNTYGGGTADGFLVRLDDQLTGVVALSVDVPPTNGRTVLPRNRSYEGTVTIDGRAPSNGLTVTLSTLPTGTVGLPATVTIPSGGCTASFPIRVASTASLGIVQLRAQASVGVSVDHPVEVAVDYPYRLTKLTALPVSSLPRAMNDAGHVVATEDYGAGGLYYDGIHVTVLSPDYVNDVDDLGRASVYAGHLNAPQLFEPSTGATSLPLGPFRGAFPRGLRGDGSRRYVTGSGSLPPIGELRAFLSTDGAALVDLGTLGGTSADGFDVNRVGTVVGRSIPTGGRWDFAFRWTSAGGMQNLGALPNHYASEARSINDADQIVGISKPSRGVMGVLWENGQGTPVGSLPGYDSSELFAINEVGMIVGHATLWNVRARHRPFLIDSVTGMRALVDLVDPVSLQGVELYDAVDINDRGQILGALIVRGATSSSQPAGVFRLDPVHVEAFGSSCPTADGRLPVLAAEGVPVRGAPFTLRVAVGPANAAGVLVLGTGRNSVPVLGCSFLVGTQIAAAPWTLDAEGRARLPVTVPGAPLPYDVVFQAAFLDAGANGGGFTATHGLEVHVQ